MASSSVNFTNHQGPIPEDFRCAICLDEEPKDLVSHNKKDIFHKGCLKTWLQTKSTCPLCNADASSDFVTVASRTNHFLKKLSNGSSYGTGFGKNIIPTATVLASLAAYNILGQSAAQTTLAVGGLSYGIASLTGIFVGTIHNELIQINYTESITKYLIGALQFYFGYMVYTGEISHEGPFNIFFQGLAIWGIARSAGLFTAIKGAAIGSISSYGAENFLIPKDYKSWSGSIGGMTGGIFKAFKANVGFTAISMIAGAQVGDFALKYFQTLNTEYASVLAGSIGGAASAITSALTQQTFS